VHQRVLSGFASMRPPTGTRIQVRDE